MATAFAEDPQPSLVDKRVDELCLQGIKYLKGMAIEDALICFTRAIYLQPSAGVLYAYRGDAYCYLCDFRSATTNYLKARRLLPDNAIIRERLARLLFCTARQDIAEGQVAEAIPLLSEARSLAPSDSLYWVYLVKAYGISRDYMSAIAELSRVLDAISTEEIQNDPAVVAMRNEGRASTRKLAVGGDGDGGKDDCSNGLDDDTLKGNGNHGKRRGKGGRGMIDISTTRILRPGTTQDIHGQDISTIPIPEFARGRPFGVTAPLYLEGLILRTRILLATDDLTRAKRDAFLAYQLHPYSPNVLDVLSSLSSLGQRLALSAQTHLLCGRLEPAVQMLTSSIDLAPTDINLYLLRALALRRCGRLDAALSDLKIAKGICERTLSEAALAQAREKDAKKAAALKQLGVQVTSLNTYSDSQGDVGSNGRGSLSDGSGEGGGGGGGDDDGIDRDYGDQHPRFSSSSPSQASPPSTASALVLATSADRNSPLVLLDRITRQIVLVLLELGQDYASKQQHVQALAVFSRVIELSPTDYQGFMYRGDSFIALSKVELGLADYSTAIECIRTQENSLSSSSASSSSPLSLPLPSSTSSPPQSAASDLLEGLPAMTTEAVEVAKYNVTQRIAKTSIELGTVLYNRGQYALAHAEYTRAVLCLPSSASCWSLRGECRMKMGMLLEAYQDMTHSLAMNPDQPRVRQSLESLNQILFSNGKDPSKLQSTLATASLSSLTLEPSHHGPTPSVNDTSISMPTSLVPYSTSSPPPSNRLPSSLPSINPVNPHAHHYRNRITGKHLAYVKQQEERRQVSSTQPNAGTLTRLPPVARSSPPSTLSIPTTDVSSTPSDTKSLDIRVIQSVLPLTTSGSQRRSLSSLNMYNKGDNHRHVINTTTTNTNTTTTNVSVDNSSGSDRRMGTQPSESLRDNALYSLDPNANTMGMKRRSHTGQQQQPLVRASMEQYSLSM